MPLNEENVVNPARQVPFLALGGLFEQDDVEAAAGVLQAASRSGGSFFPLPEENDFQDAFARHEGAAKTVAVNSCGTALDLCMMALDVGPGDEVIVPPLTFVCAAASERLTSSSFGLMASVPASTWIGLCGSRCMFLEGTAR